MHRLFPDGKALARCQPVTQRTGLIGLVGISGPIQGLDQFLAKEQQVIPLGLRQGDGEDTCGLRAESLRLRHALRQGMRCPDRPSASVPTSRASSGMAAAGGTVP